MQLGRLGSWAGWAVGQVGQLGSWAVGQLGSWAAGQVGQLGSWAGNCSYKINSKKLALLLNNYGMSAKQFKKQAGLNFTTSTCRALAGITLRQHLLRQ